MKPSLTTKALFSNFFVPTRTKCLQKCWPDQEENRCYFSARSEAADQERTIFQESSIRPHLFVAHKKTTGIPLAPSCCAVLRFLPLQCLLHGACFWELVVALTVHTSSQNHGSVENGLGGKEMISWRHPIFDQFSTDPKCLEESLLVCQALILPFPSRLANRFGSSTTTIQVPWKRDIGTKIRKW